MVKFIWKEALNRKAEPKIHERWYFYGLSIKNLSIGVFKKAVGSSISIQSILKSASKNNIYIEDREQVTALLNRKQASKKTYKQLDAIFSIVNKNLGHRAKLLLKQSEGDLIIIVRAKKYNTEFYSEMEKTFEEYSPFMSENLWVCLLTDYSYQPNYL